MSRCVRRTERTAAMCCGVCCVQSAATRVGAAWLVTGPSLNARVRRVPLMGPQREGYLSRRRWRDWHAMRLELACGQGLCPGHRGVAAASAATQLVAPKAVVAARSITAPSNGRLGPLLTSRSTDQVAKLVLSVPCIVHCNDAAGEKTS